MTPDELAAIEARANAATPGPWLWHDDDLWHGMTADALDAYNADPTGRTAPDPFDGKNTEDFSISWGDIIHPEDGAFIAAARQDVPALVAEVRRLRARVDELEQATTTAEWTVPQPLEAGDQTLGTAPPWLTDAKRATPLLRQQIETAVPSYRVVAHPETMQLDPPLTIEAGEIALWATDGSKVGRYRRNDAGEWRLIEQREVQP